MSLPKKNTFMGNGALVIKSKPFSDHPGDWYLGVVLAKFGGQFVTWIYNSDGCGACEGHYFEDDLERATADFNGRGA